jgi:N-acetyl-gamma-glutamyl-phosphate reductase
MERFRIAIAGLTGYTGLELLRILRHHPQVDIAHLLVRQSETLELKSIAPHLAHTGLQVSTESPEKIARDCDAVFLALPHGVTQHSMSGLIDKTRVIDLSADFRLQDKEQYAKFYGAHSCPEHLPSFTYGLPELFRSKIKKALHIANPGCFALLCQTLLYPLKERIIKADIMAVTGSSGSGKSPGSTTHHPARHHNLKSYSINSHRHQAEILQSTGLDPEQLNFVPTSGAFVRGIFATAFLHVDKPFSESELEQVFNQAYENEPFIRFSPNPVELAHILGSNFLDLHFSCGKGQTLVIQGVLDNMVKGAAGTAVQNFNLMFGLPETMGLEYLDPVYP